MHSLSNEYRAKLSADFGAPVAQAIDAGAQAASIQSGAEISYVRLGETNENRPPVMIINGFSAGIVANGAFAAALAHEGHDVILTGQYDGTVVPLHHRDGARRSHASAALAVLEQEQLSDKPVNFVTHSYGSLVFEALSKLAADRGHGCIQGSRVAMLAPAGVKRDEASWSFLPRYVALLRAGNSIEKRPESYWQFEKEMLGAGVSHVKAHPWRSLQEGREAMRRKIDFPEVFNRGIGAIALIPFAEDRLYGQDILDRSISTLLSDRLSAFSAYSLEWDEAKGRFFGLTGSDHSDQQFNPKRVATAVAQFLRS